MRIEHSVVSVSWIPSEAVRGSTKMAFEAGVTHYDEPPPDEIEDLEALHKAGRFRFANRLSAYIEVDEAGRITSYGHLGGGLITETIVKLGGLSRAFEPVALPEIQLEPEVGDGWVRFVQTTGGRTGLPAPRRVRRAPFIQWRAPLVWTTLSLTLHADGTSDFELVGASRFPRHWVYGPDAKLAAKSGLTDFRDWYAKSFGKKTPWGDEDSPALVTAVETALERSLSSRMMGGGKPKVKNLKKGTTIVAEGDPSDEVFLVLDGVVLVEAGGQRLAEYGPGAVLGERSGLEGGGRTATLVAVTPCRVASVPHGQLDRGELEELSKDHRREERRA